MQLKIEELRAGNYIEYNNQFLPVLGVNTTKHFKDLATGTIQLPKFIDGIEVTETGAWAKDCKPIPLTRELMIQLGFQQITAIHLNFRVDPYFVVSMVCDKFGNPDDHVQVIMLDFNPSRFLRINCNYIHQLQNIVYFVTGTELTGKL